MALVVCLNLNCLVECGFDSILEGKTEFLAEYERMRLVSLWVSLLTIGSAQGHRHSFREEQRGRWSQGDNVTLGPTDRHRDLGSQLWLYFLCVWVCLGRDMLSVFMNIATIKHLPQLSEPRNILIVSVRWNLVLVSFQLLTGSNFKL